MKRPILAALLVSLLLPALAAPLGAQGTSVAFGGMKADPTLPVEVTSDSLSVNRTDGTALFTGNVVVSQGKLRLTAGEVRVEYAAGGSGRVERMKATGGVTLVSATEAAEAREALYSVASGTVVMTGDVLLTQGANAMRGQTLTVDLTAGTGRMEGRVRTMLAPAKK